MQFVRQRACLSSFVNVQSVSQCSVWPPYLSHIARNLYCSVTKSDDQGEAFYGWVKHLPNADSAEIRYRWLWVYGDVRYKRHRVSGRGRGKNKRWVESSRCTGKREKQTMSGIIKAYGEEGKTNDEWNHQGVRGRGKNKRWVESSSSEWPSLRYPELGNVDVLATTRRRLPRVISCV